MEQRKTAIVTGATSGIGKAYARSWAERGYRLLLTGRREERLRAFAEELAQRYGVPVEVELGELSDREEAGRLAGLVRELKPDVLVNNAGFGLKGLAWQVDEGEACRMLALHTECVLRLSLAALEGMRDRGTGILVNVASDAAYCIVPGNAVYSGTKSFIRQFTEGLYLDLRTEQSGVKVQALCPGLTKTDFQLRMGMDPDQRKDRGILHWQEPEQVVAQSLRGLERGKPLCICGGWKGKLEYLLGTRLPRALFYRIAAGLWKG